MDTLMTLSQLLLTRLGRLVLLQPFLLGNNWSAPAPTLSRQGTTSSASLRHL